MGYTHYWSSIRPTAEIAEDARKLIEASGVSICSGSGHGSPILTEGLIMLNGDVEKDEDFESFILDGTGGFQFCKTGRRAYDAVVTAILIDCLQKQVPGWDSISSDGNTDDWQDGIRLYAKVFGLDRTALTRAVGRYFSTFGEYTPVTEKASCGAGKSDPDADLVGFVHRYEDGTISVSEIPLMDEEKAIIQLILSHHTDEGQSIRGRREEILADPDSWSNL